MLSLLLVALSGPPAPVPELWHVYQGERRALALDVRQVAVFGPTDGLGLAPGDVRPWPIAGWSLVSVAEGQRTPAGVRGAVDGMLARGAAFVAPVFVGEDGGPLFPTRDILVGTDGSPAALALARETGDVLTEDWGGIPGAFRVRSPERDGLLVLAVANALAETPGITFAEPDMVVTGGPGHFPNDPEFSNCWGLHNDGTIAPVPDVDLDCPEAWDVTLGDSAITVVIIDTGVDPSHPDIHQIPGADFTSEGPGNGGPVNAFDNHGTAVAGCVSAVIDNGVGIAGVAPGCPVASARCFISVDLLGSWTGQASWTGDALAWAESIGARVTNNSNYYNFPSAAVAQSYLTSRNHGLVHFSSAGNFASQGLTWPASLASVNGITAVQGNGTLAGFSNYGPGVAFAAPGNNIYTTDRSGSAGYSPGDYTWTSGTSFAAPYAAGVAALVLSEEPALSARSVEEAMISGADDYGAPGHDPEFGWGLVNARASFDHCGTAVAHCSPKPNATGETARTTYAGSLSVAADDFALRVTGLGAGWTGVFFYGPGTTSLPFGKGLLCVGGSKKRLGMPFTATAAGAKKVSIGLASGPASTGPNAILPGTTFSFQCWYEDPPGTGRFNLSDALRATFCP